MLKWREIFLVANSHSSNSSSSSVSLSVCLSLSIKCIQLSMKSNKGFKTTKKHIYSPLEDFHPCSNNLETGQGCLLCCFREYGKFKLVFKSDSIPVLRETCIKCKYFCRPGLVGGDLRQVEKWRGPASVLQSLGLSA